MQIITLLDELVKLLNQEECSYALAGGFVASFYREDQRLTQDLDLLLLSNSTEDTAKDVLSKLGYEVAFVKLHQLKSLPMMNKKSQPNLMAVGRSPDRDFGVDFILPGMPWFDKALKRSKANQLNFGFAQIPCLTVEDLIISKVFAARMKDYDDISSMIKQDNQIDYDYLFAELLALKLQLPSELLGLLPDNLKKVFKKLS